MNGQLERLLLFFDQGGGVTWAILGASLLMWTLIIERYWYFLRAAPQERRRLESRWRDMYRGSPRLVVRVRDALVAGHCLRSRRFLVPIRTLTGVLPLLGLLGTVSGMIDTFDVLAEFGSGNVRGMAAGISRALFTTMAGLLTALSGYYFSANLESRARKEERRITHLLK